MAESLSSDTSFGYLGGTKVGLRIFTDEEAEYCEFL